MKKQNVYKKEVKPLVSVIIPVFNGASYLKEAVTSAQTSTFKQYEIILIDDGSTDHSKKICKALEKRYKNVTFYSFTNNKGLGKVLNVAVAKAQGKYICRLNQDDRMLPFRMKTQVAFLEARPDVVAVGSCIKLFDEKGKVQLLNFLKRDKDIKKMWHIVSPFSDPSVMYRKEIAIKAGGYKQAFWPADDTHLWYRMGMLGKLANIQRPLVEVRWHDKAASVKYFRKLAISTFWMHRWAHKNVGNAPLLIQIFWFVQLFCGLVFSPQFNWGVYRLLKKGINTLPKRNHFSLNISYQSLTAKVLTQKTVHVTR